MPTQQELATLIDTHIWSGDQLKPTVRVSPGGLEVSRHELSILAEATSAFMEIVRGATPRDGVIPVPDATAEKPEVLALNQIRLDKDSLDAIDAMPVTQVSQRARAVIHQAAQILEQLGQIPDMILVRLADGVNPADIDPTFEGTTIDDKVVMTNATIVARSGVTDYAREGSYSDWGQRPNVEADLAIVTGFRGLDGQRRQATSVGQVARMVQMGDGLKKGQTPATREETAHRDTPVDVWTFDEYYAQPKADRTWPNRDRGEIQALEATLRSNYPGAPPLSEAAIELEALGVKGFTQQLAIEGRGETGSLGIPGGGPA